MDGGPPCKRRMEMPHEHAVQGTSFGLNFVTYQEYQVIKMEHEQMKQKMHYLQESMMTEMKKTLFAEIDYIKRENKQLKDEISQLKKTINETNRSGRRDNVMSLKVFFCAYQKVFCICQFYVSFTENGSGDKDGPPSLSEKLNQVAAELASLKATIHQQPPGEQASHLVVQLLCFSLCFIPCMLSIQN